MLKVSFLIFNGKDIEKVLQLSCKVILRSLSKRLSQPY